MKRLFYYYFCSIFHVSVGILLSMSHFLLKTLDQILHLVFSLHDFPQIFSVMTLSWSYGFSASSKSILVRTNIRSSVVRLALFSSVNARIAFGNFPHTIAYLVLLCFPPDDALLQKTAGVAEETLQTEGLFRGRYMRAKSPACLRLVAS